MVYIIIVVISLIIVISGIIIIKKNQNEEKKYYETAYRMSKEDYLTESLKNVDRDNHNTVVVPMVYIKACNTKPKQGYVFNPLKEICIGRDKYKNSIWIPYETISMEHCKLFAYEGNVFIQDLYSSNGTYVKHGLRKYFVNPGECMQLESKDKIMVGDAIFRVVIFYFKTTMK